MAGYYIYIPGAEGADPNHLDRVGLGLLRADCSPSFSPVLERGPDNGRGVLAWWDDPRNPAPPAVRVESQVWQAAPQYGELPEGRYWLGYEKASPPGPGDLQRRAVHNGADVVLSDGNAWHIPIARQLPHILGIGKPRVKDAYRPFFDQAMHAINTWLIVGDSGPLWAFDQVAAFGFVAAALAVNYRLTPDIVSMLELVGSDNIRDVLDVVCEGPAAVARVLDLIEKKNHPADASLSDTPAISSSDSGQAS